MTATVTRVSPNPKRLVADEDRETILSAKSAHEAAYAAYQSAVLASLQSAGVRAVAELTGLSTNTIMRWKRDAED